MTDDAARDDLQRRLMRRFRFSEQTLATNKDGRFTPTQDDKRRQKAPLSPITVCGLLLVLYFVVLVAQGFEDFLLTTVIFGSFVPLGIIANVLAKRFVSPRRVSGKLRHVEAAGSGAGRLVVGSGVRRIALPAQRGDAELAEAIGRVTLFYWRPKWGRPFVLSAEVES